MKCHKYNPDDEFILTHSKDGDLQSLIGKSGYIIERYFGENFDYRVLIGGQGLKVRESEIKVISNINNRKSWDEYFLDIAEMVGTRSTCERLHVGCVLVKDKQIISTGYNGSISGHEHCTGGNCLKNEQGRCIKTIHAEQNALLFADRHKLEGSTAYVTHEPCETCTKLLAQAGIKKVVFRNAYENKWNKHFNKDMIWLHLER